MSERMPQPMRPTGFVGRIFGFIMERLSEPNYRWVMRQLAAVKPKAYLEIGFGTGRLAELVAQKFKPTRIVGLDPSELMVKTTRKKLKRFARKIDLSLTQGDNTMLGTLAGPFDAVVATHSFQFWSEPLATLAQIHALLALKGVLVLVLRKHFSKSVIPWLPNPISRSGDELGGTRKALVDCGYRIVADETLKTGSFGIVAIRAVP